MGTTGASPEESPSAAHHMLWYAHRVNLDLARSLEESLARGESVAVATIVGGSNPGPQMLIWAAGQTRGDLGWPRLNQRVALYAEQLFEKGARAVSKPFAVHGQRFEVSFEFHLPVSPSARSEER
jgi:hypothetical protein